MYDFTVITPHFNAPEYLKMMLESIPVRPNIQIIVVDDKSDKDVEKYLALKRDNAFKHVTFLDNNTEYKGPGICRNTALQRAEGKWVLFIDSDDFFVEGFYSAIEKYINSKYDIIFFPPVSADRDTLQYAERCVNYRNIVVAYHHSPTHSNELNLRYRLTNSWSKMINNEFIKKHELKFHNVLIGPEDVIFNIRAGYHMKAFTTSEDVIYCITNSESSLMKIMSEKSYDMSLEAFIWKYTYLQERLSRYDFKSLGLCAAEGHIYKVLKFGLGYKKLFNVIRLLKKSKVRIVTGQYINPIFLIRRYREERAFFKNNKRFFVRK